MDDKKKNDIGAGSEPGSWEIAGASGRVGTGNWAAWDRGMEPIYQAAENWRVALAGIEKPWLCWNIHDEWCQLQQKLVLEAGWTPIVGNDTYIKSPTIINGAVYVNFNSSLQLPTMWMHFPLEFLFLFVPRLAFWHSDFLCSVRDMKRFAKIFESLEDGSCASAYARDSRWPWRNKHRDRYFELIGCSTSCASEDQFRNGTGWWRHIKSHPNSHLNNGEDCNYEHGTGILIWEKLYKGKVVRLNPNEKNGHCNVYMKKLKGKGSKKEELDSYYSLVAVAKNLGIAHLL